jgi:catechol 2,3-dioxygenase-like lactoylglutathione lyase family enzyme
VGFDHLVLVVADVERSLSWYGRHAGLDGVRVVEWRAGSAPFPSLRVTDEVIIDLVPGEVDGRGHLDHFCLVVTADHLEALRGEADLEVLEEGQRFGAQGVATSIYVRDPDGVLVEFRSYPVA